MAGIILAIEGSDGSGKHTQAKLLLERLKKEGKKAELFSFPEYRTFSGKLVSKYLRGEFGSLEKVMPEFAALLYSLDRYKALPRLLEALGQGKIVVCDRYVASNIAHQASKFTGVEREKFTEWLSTVESKMPKPALTIFLDLPVPVSAKLMQERKGKNDIHEVNQNYLNSTREVYLSLSMKPDWTRIECAEGTGIKKRQEIHRLVWEAVKQLVSG